MSVTFNPRQDRYFVCPQCGPTAMGYGTYSVPQCYDGDCFNNMQCGVRERLRDFYADGVQGGSPSCRKCDTQRTDVQSQTGLRPPFLTYAVNYWGDNDVYRQRPYGGGVTYPDTPYEAQGHYCAQPPQELLMVPPLGAGVCPSVKTLQSAQFVNLGAQMRANAPTRP